MRAISAWRSNSGIFWRSDEAAVAIDGDEGVVDAGGAFWRNEGAEAIEAIEAIGCAEADVLGEAGVGPLTADCRVGCC